MKLILRTLLIGLAIYLLPGTFPWWMVMIISLVAGFALPGPALNVFISGFLGGGATWLLMAWQIDRNTNSFLTEKMVQLFPFSDPFFLVILSGVVGGVIAALGSLSGASFRQIFSKKKSNSLYS